jgi:hypothetical protein
MDNPHADHFKGQFCVKSLSPESARPMPEPLAPGQPVPSGMDLFHYVVQSLDKGCDTAHIRDRRVVFGYAAKLLAKERVACIHETERPHRFCKWNAPGDGHCVDLEWTTVGRQGGRENGEGDQSPWRERLS